MPSQGETGAKVRRTDRLNDKFVILKGGHKTEARVFPNYEKKSTDREYIKEKIIEKLYYTKSKFIDH